MAITVVCPSCGTRLKAGEQMVGRRGECPSCEAIIVVQPQTQAGKTAGTAAASAPAATTAAAESGAPGDGGYELAEPIPRLTLAEVLTTPKPTVTAADAAKAKSYGSVWGIGLTRRRLVIVGVLAGALVGLWWFGVGPGRSLRVVKVETVSAYTALEGLVVLDSQDGPVNSFGGGDELIVARPDRRGKFVIVHAELTRQMLQRHRMAAGDRIELNADAFELRSYSGKTYKPVMLVHKLTSGERLDLAHARADSYRAILPPRVEPAEQQVNHDDAGGVVSGTVRYDGIDMVRGEVDFVATGGQGVMARGRLHVHREPGIELDYRYDGDTMTVTWSDQAAGWYAAKQ
ncbi:MAG: hypothetical protein V3U29_02725, partial [Phycisphaeraceae bacterium]